MNLHAHTRTHTNVFISFLPLPPFFTLYSPFSSALSVSHRSLTKQLALLLANWGALLWRGARQSAWWGIKWWLINLLLSWSSNWELYETPSSQPAQSSKAQSAHTHTPTLRSRPASSLVSGIRRMELVLPLFFVQQRNSMATFSGKRLQFCSFDTLNVDDTSS